MTDVSGRLRAERERAGLTLEEMSARTKIKVAFLQALEQGEFERLPGEFFARAFLRTYGRELQLPADDLVAAYDAARRPVVQAEAEPHPVADLLQRRGQLEPRRLQLASSRSIWPTVALAAAILVVISVMNRPAPERAGQQVPVGTSGVAQAAGPADRPPVPDDKPPQKLTIEIAPTRVMWVAGTADGERVIYRLVEPGENVRLDAENEFWFRVGDAGAFVYSINGSAAKPLGRPGEVREFTINRENARTFQSEH